MEEFNEFGYLPKNLDLACMDDSEVIEATLHSHIRHDSCRFEYNKSKLSRAQKRKAPVEESTLEPPQKFARLSLQGESSSSKNFFFFCVSSESKEQSLCRALTFSCAAMRHEITDENLLAKLSAANLIAQDTRYHLQCLISLNRS